MGCLAPSNNDSKKEKHAAKKESVNNQKSKHQEQPRRVQTNQAREEEKERMRIEVLKKKNQNAPKLHIEQNHLYKDRLNHQPVD